ncbi:MAG: hypothetical protein AABZ78_00750 [Chloroflexota bacterium]
MIKKLYTILVLVLIATLGVSACQAKPQSTEAPRGLSLPQSPLLAMLERKSGLITYVGDDGNIYVVNQSGTNPLQITKDGKLTQNNFRRYFFPTWSHDSKSVAFYSVSAKNQTDIKSSIFTVGSDGKNLVEAFTSNVRLPVYLSWSPDSKSLSFITNTDGSSSMMLSTVPSSGGTAQTVDVGNPYYWDWQPDSKGILIHTGGATEQNKSARLSFLSLADSVVEDRLGLNPSFFQTPDLSPDGSQMILATNENGKRSIVLADRTGRVQKTIEEVAGSAAFSWSPDGKRLAYIAGTQAQAIVRGKLNFYDVAKGTKVVADQDKISAFFWSPDSKQVVYFAIVQEPVTTPTPSKGGTPAATPEDQQAADTQLYLKMYITDVTSGKSTLLARFVPTRDFFQLIQFFDQYSRSGTIWAPDGQNLVIAAQMSDSQGVFLVPSSGNTEPRYLQGGAMAFWSWK